MNDTTLRINVPHEIIILDENGVIIGSVQGQRLTPLSLLLMKHKEWEDVTTI